MTMKQVWLITGAGRGMGVDIAKAALAGGHAVVATGRDPKKIAAVIVVPREPRGNAIIRNASRPYAE